MGIYRTCEQHLEAAFNIEHPVESATRLPEELLEASSSILACSFSDTVMRRVKQLKASVDLAATLTQQENRTRESMDKMVNHVTRNKKIELFRSMLQQTDFPDMSVVDVLQYGVKLTGWEPSSPLYSKRINPPMSEEMLDAQAVWRRRAMTGKPMSEEESLLAPQLWAETMDEVERGFLHGPFSESQVDSMLMCTDWSASKRFLLLQGLVAPMLLI